MSKTPRVLALGAAAALLGGLTTAHAAPAFIYTGTPGSEFEMKFSGRTTETSPLPAVGSGLETTWGIGYVNEFQNKNNPSEKFWQSSVPGFGNATITYMIYGIADAQVSGTAPNINIYNVGCTVGPACDGKIHIDFYIDEAGPGGTNPSFTDPANGAAARVGTTVNHWTDDTFLMSWELVPGVVPSDDPGTLFDERDTVLLQTVTSESLPATGVGVFFANCVAGPGCAILGVTPTTWTDLGNPVVADLFGRFNLSTTTAAEQAVGWLGDTFDPVRGVTAVPAPAAAAVLGFALLGLAGLSSLSRRGSR
jgi:hypothetical protein